MITIYKYASIIGSPSVKYSNCICTVLALTHPAVSHKPVKEPDVFEVADEIV